MKGVDRIILMGSWGSAFLLTGALCAILAHVVLRGAGTLLDPRLFFGDTPALEALMLKRQVFDGLLPAMAGTLCLVVLAVAIAVPSGLAAGIYLAEYAGGAAKKIFDFLLDVLAGVPSIVVGLFGFAAAVFLHRHVAREIAPCLLIAALALALLVLPYIIRSTQLALEGLPGSTRVTALALGATRLQNLRHVLLPRALNGILTGVILAVGRCAEDTAVILLTGAVAAAGIPKSLLDPFEALPFYIYYISSQYSSPEQLLTGYGAALILLVICLSLYAFAFVVKRRLSHIALYRA